MHRRHPDVIEMQASHIDLPGKPKEGGELRIAQIRELRRLTQLHPPNRLPDRFAPALP
jgi:hypothetical protein